MTRVHSPALTLLETGRGSIVRSIANDYRRIGLATCVALLLSSFLHAATAQDQLAQHSHRAYFAPTFAIGPSLFVAELWESSRQAAGVLLRGGVRTPYIDVTGSLETWPDVKSFHITTILVEGMYLLHPRGEVTPFLLLGLGHAWSTYHGDARRWTNLDGTAASFGLGLEWAAEGRLAIRTEGLLRTDDGGYNAAVRILLGWNAGDSNTAPLPMQGHGDVVAYWMTPVSGPWRFVEPGYGFRFSRVRGQMGTSLAFAVFHWQIPGDAFLRSYVWDTRAFLALPSLEWHPGEDRTLALRVGPSVTMMGEGPGNGASFGGHLDATWSPSWAAPFSAGVGWLWMRHDTDDARITRADQHGLMVFAGLHF